MQKKFILIIRRLICRNASVGRNFRVGGIVTALIVTAQGTDAQSLFTRAVNANTSVYGIVVDTNKEDLFLTCTDWFGIDNGEYEHVSEILKSDMDGNLIWQKKQGGIQPDRGTALYGLLQIDTTILACGSTDVKSKSAAVLLHYSRGGTLLDYHTYKLIGYNVPGLVPNLITLTDDNHLVMCGLGGSGWGSSLMWLRTSFNGQNGQLMITRWYPQLWPAKLLPMNNGNGEVIMACHGYSHGGDEGRRPRLLRIDSNGVIIWQKKFDVGYNASLEDVIHLKKGGYILIGNGTYRSYILKTDDDFNVLWMKSAEFAYTDTSWLNPQFNEVLEKENQHLLIGGSQANGDINNYALIAETDLDGNLIEARLDSNGNVFNKLTALPHGYTLMAGRDHYDHLRFSTLDSTSNYSCKLSPAELIWYSDALPLALEGDVQLENAGFTTDNSIDLWQDTVSNLVYDGCTNIVTVTIDAAADKNLQIYPNPANGNVTVEATLQRKESIALKIFDVAGKVVFAEDKAEVVKSFSKQLDLSHLSAGIYFIQFIHNGKREVKKFMIEK